MRDFKGAHFRGEIVLWAVRWYWRYRKVCSLDYPKEERMQHISSHSRGMAPSSSLSRSRS